eukprot:g341.t1
MLSIVFVSAAIIFCSSTCIADQGQPKKIAIIGGGIAGGSTSFYVTEFLKNNSMSPVDITVFERRDYIGGRLKHIRFGQQNIKIEIGGAAWTDDNIYMTEMANAVGINVTRRKITNANSEDKIEKETMAKNLFSSKLGDVNNVGVWDGSKIIDLEKFGLKNLKETFKVGTAELKFLKQVKENYAKQTSSDLPFHNLTSFLKWGNLNMYTNKSIHEFFTSNGADISNDFIEIGMVPLNRAIYNQGSKANTFGFLASLTAQLSQHTVTDGNSELVKALFNYSKSKVLLNAYVSTISMNKKGGGSESNENSFTVYYNLNNNKTTLTEVFDIVVIASPLEVTNIDFVNINLSKDAYINREYYDWYITVVEASSINMKQFKPYNFPSDKEYPSTIVTTTNSTEKDRGFVVIQPLGRHAKIPAPSNIWMVYSDESIKDDINNYFVNPNLKTLFEHYWPYTFPHLNVIANEDAKVQPVTLNEEDGGGGYIIRNVGKLIKQYLSSTNKKETTGTIKKKKVPPTLPTSFTANITRRVHYSSLRPGIKIRDPPTSNLTLYLDLPNNKQYIADYSAGYLVQSWSLYNLSPPKLWTYDKYGIPQPPHCICLTSSPPLLPEFLNMKNATYHGTETIRSNIKTDKWVVINEIISGDKYIVWTKEGTNIPVRVQWIDPEGGNKTMTETSDYFNFINHAPNPNVFDVSGNLYYSTVPCFCFMPYRSSRKKILNCMLRAGAIISDCL